jgi:hypothetical protein
MAIRIGLCTALIGAVGVAQLTATAGPSGADTAFVPGTATSSAGAITVGASVGQLNASVILGTSDADYENNEGQALSQILDLGLIGDVLYANNCQTGAASTVQPSDFPPAEQAESTTGDKSLTYTENKSLATGGIGVADESATATQVPSGSSTTTISEDDLAGLVTVQGATTTAKAAIVNGVTRSATAASTISNISLLGGAVKIDGLQWTAEQASGASTSSSAAFTITGLTVGGVTVPVSNDDVTTVTQIINTVLTPVGLNIQWPAVTTASDGTVNVSPLIVGVDNSALGQELVGANLGKIQTVRQELTQALFNYDCNLPGYVEVADIALAVPAGGGDLDIDLGGASAQTTDLAPVSPFAALGATLGNFGGGGDDTFTSPSTFVPATPGTPAIPGTPLSTTTTTGSPKVTLGPLVKTTSCSSVGPAGGGCNRSNVALPVGLIGLGLLSVLAAWDYLRQRRRRRLLGQEA